MADWAFCTSGAAKLKAGANANETIVGSGAALLEWYNEAVGRIECETSTAWSDNLSLITSGAYFLLGDVASSLIAMRIINYDLTGYLGSEARTMLDINDDIVNKGLQILKDPKSHTLNVP